ncbi:hypothetical protein, partial [Paraburkholderia domus]|uniref:hypothetical protein n=1 Tax=Paraburkholderia domus TaxID=2793075 RepID=UPI001B8B4F06
MSRIASSKGRLEHWLARLLHYGTWVAAGTIATGLAISLSRNIAWKYGWFSGRFRVGNDLETKRGRAASERRDAA